MHLEVWVAQVTWPLIKIPTNLFFFKKYGLLLYFPKAFTEPEKWIIEMYKAGLQKHF